jgi:hypothetical protein
MRLLIYFFVYFLILANDILAQKYHVGNIEILPQKDRLYSYLEVTSTLKNKFIPYDTSTKPTEGDAIFWAKFRYSQISQYDIYYLFYHHIWFKKIELYFSIEDSIYYQKSGNNLKFKERTIQDPLLLLKLPNSVDTIECYLRIESNFSYWCPIYVHENTKQQLENFYSNTTESFFFGISFLSIIISLSFFIFIKEKIYVYYILIATMIMLSRSMDGGFLYNYLPFDLLFTKIRYVMHIYSFCSMGITVALYLYVSEFLKIKFYSPKTHRNIYYFVAVRIAIWILHLIFYKTDLDYFFGSIYLDSFVIIILLIVSVFQFRNNPKLSLLAIIGISMILLGYASHLFEIPLFGFSGSYNSFVNLSSLEVIIFSISVAYRHNFLKKENEKSMNLLIKQLKENEHLKDNINKELELKVNERTAKLNHQAEEIAKMNELLKFHNIALEHEVLDISKARILQKNIKFEEFAKIFPTEDICLSYLAELKWNDNRKYKCIKCGYDNFKVVNNQSRKCRSCDHIESPLSNTLFHNIKFPLQKAFYITYLTSSGTKDQTIEEIAKLLNLRTATFWAFKQKVLALMDKTKSRKKHKDGWTHLIEYSIE